MRFRKLSAALALVLVSWWSATAYAQLDPLLFVKRVHPTVIIVVDTSLKMLEDGQGRFYDPHFYSTTADPAVMSAFSGLASARTYRRRFQNLQYAASPGKYTAAKIEAIPAAWDPAAPLTSNAPADIAFMDPTRYAITKKGIAAAVSENAGSSFRWGLVRLRQSSPQWRVSPNCDRPVAVSDPLQSFFGDTTPCFVGTSGTYGVYAPSVAAASYLQTTAPAGTVMVTPTVANSAAAVLGVVNRPVGDNLGLVPGGVGAVGFEDRPITYALLDAKAAAEAAMNADSAANRACRNTVVVLITGGRNDGSSAYRTANPPGPVATQFRTISAGGVTRRVPIHVVAIRPAASDENELQTVADNSGGRFVRVTTSDHTQAVEDVAAAINYAVQHGFARSTDVDLGRVSEYTGVSPIVGTVNITDMRGMDGTALPNTEVTAPDGRVLPQRSNVLITAGFTLPGFEGRVRAFRTYRPVADATKPSGYKFVNDGTRLWPDLDGRPHLAGLARTPADSTTRNIYTYVPDGSGGGSVVSFTGANAALLEPHMRTGVNTAAMIDFVRSQPIGAIIGSTPALMDPPSLDPPPDDDYGRSDATDSFAGKYRDRRAIIFFGANDGMIHAVDARTGYEVWAFIPYNLLPKLRALADGQPVEQFDYFVDSSPKIAEVKINGEWRSTLIIGQGPGGTFYQAFDVTEAGMGVEPWRDDLATVGALLSRFDSPDESIRFKWAFPNYSSFDPTYTGTFTVYDGTPGGRVKLYGDLRPTATLAEKTVGFTWSDPAVGPLDANRATTAVITGSGYFPAIEDGLPGRGTGAPRAGNALYLLDIDTGQLLGNSGSSCPLVSNGSGSGLGCVNVGNIAANGRKNALQADPSAAGDSGNSFVTKAYLGDIDGQYWRFSFTANGEIRANLMANTGAPIYASSALLFLGSRDIYMFFSTGSDLLPATAPGGTGIFRLYGLKDNAPGSGATTIFARDLATVTVSGGVTVGERPSTSPSVAGDIVFYSTTVEPSSACANQTSNLYGITYLGGPAYDSNNDGMLSPNETPIFRSVAGRATAPFIVDQHLYFGTAGADGVQVEAFGDPEDFNNGIGQVGVRILSWREIR